MENHFARKTYTLNPKSVLSVIRSRKAISVAAVEDASPDEAAAFAALKEAPNLRVKGLGFHCSSFLGLPF